MTPTVHPSQPIASTLWQGVILGCVST